MSKWKFFSETEVKGLDEKLVSKLDSAREIANFPFLITSGLRTCAANQAAMGVEASSHLSGKAVDLAVTDSRQRFLMVRALLAAGFRRIGAYDRHVHVDTDETKDLDVLWVGVSH